MVRLLLIATMAIGLGCGKARSPIHHTPFARTDWSPIPPDRSTGQTAEGTKRRSNGSNDDLRTEMREAAEALLKQGESRLGYGALDLQNVLSEVGVEVGWRAEKELDFLVQIAQKRDAYSTDGEMDVGDIVLFHNQVDANGNGELDDWLSGCGIVTAIDLPRFKAVVRTGNAPRIVTVWPDATGRRVQGDNAANSYLRVPHRSDPEGTQYLAGQLFAGTIDIEKLADSP